MATATQETTAESAAKPAATEATTDAKSAFVNEDVLKMSEDYTAAAREQFDTMMQAFTGNSEEMREKAEEAFGEMRTRFEATQKRAADINANLVEAAQTEASEAVQFANDLVKANSFTDALDIQRNYWTNLFETRVERTRKLTEATVESARENLTPVSSDFGKIFDTSAFENMFRFPTTKA